MIPPCPRGRDMEAKVSSWEMLGNGGRRGRGAERRGKRMEDDEKGDQKYRTGAMWSLRETVFTN